MPDITNTKAPISPHDDTLGTRYADLYHEYECCVCGTHHTKYRDPQGSNNFNSQNGPSGAFEHDNQNGSNDGANSVFTEFRHKHRFYGNNHSHHVAQNREEYSGANSNKNIAGELSHNSVGNHTMGANNTATAQNDSAHIRAKTTGVGTSTGDMDMGTPSNQKSDHGDGYQAHTAGDSHYAITKGDYGHHIQKGSNGDSYDVRVETGKMQLNTPKNDMYLNSGTKMIHSIGKGGKNGGGSEKVNITMDTSTITLKVGGSSIKIEDGKITITSAQVIFNKGGGGGGGGGGG